MKLSRARQIVGYEIDVSKGRFRLDDGTEHKRDVFRASGVHPVYNFPVTTYGRVEVIAIEGLVENNYREIGAIVRREQGYRCLGCGRLVPLEIDHIIPRSKGRLDTRGNLRGLGIDRNLGGCGCHVDRHKYSDWKPEYGCAEELCLIATR